MIYLIEKEAYNWISCNRMYRYLLSNFCTYYEGITTGAYTQNYVQLFDYLTSIVVFLIIKYIFTVKQSEKVGVEKVICLGGSLTFGIIC